MPRMLKSSQFWIGIAIGTVVGPMLIGRVSPALKAKIPG